VDFDTTWDRVKYCRCLVLVLVAVVMEAGTTTRWPRFQQRGTFAYLGLYSTCMQNRKPVEHQDENVRLPVRKRDNQLLSTKYDS
jgi:hypothetical protein